MQSEHELELIERYQAAWVTRRKLRVVAEEWRSRGEVDTLAEQEIALNEGREAACFWLLGKTPVAPLSAVPAVVTAETIRVELDLADRLRRQTAADPRKLLDSYEGHPWWAAGVAETLRWRLDRQFRTS